MLDTYKYNRRSLRLKHYDYSRVGFYFITICTQGKEHLFGEIVDDEMVLGLAGEMVHTLWYEMIDDFPHIALHEFVIMPNHIHGIIEIVGCPLWVPLIRQIQLECMIKYIHIKGIHKIEGTHKGCPYGW